MKKKVLVTLIGMFCVMSVLAGCGLQKEEEVIEVPETTFHIVAEADMELIVEPETVVDTEKISTSANKMIQNGNNLENSGSDLSGMEQTLPAISVKNGQTDTIGNQETKGALTEQTEGIGNKQAMGTIAEQSEEAETQRLSETLIREEDYDREIQLDVSAEGGNGLVAETAYAAENETVPGSESMSGTESETESESLTETETAAESESVTEAKTETEPMAVTESLTETELPTESETASESELVSEDAAVSETGETSENEAAEEASILKIINDRINVRTEPSTESEIKALLSVGMKVIALEADGEWQKIKFESEGGLAEGYIKSEFMSEPDTLYGVTEIINVREQDSTDSEILGQLKADELVVVLENQENGWSEVKFEDEEDQLAHTAFVKTEFLYPIDVWAEKMMIVSEAKQLQSENAE